MDISRIYFLKKQTNPERHFPKINCQLDIFPIILLTENFQKQKPNLTHEKMKNIHDKNKKKFIIKKKAPTMVQICKLENIKHKSMK